MIAWVEGMLREKTPSRVVVVAGPPGGGVGYELLVSLATYTALPDEGKAVSLHVHTHARENAIQLYGFAELAERDAFELLLRANRVGPKLAQTILSGIDAEKLVSAIGTGDVRGLEKVPGVGKKTAERIAVELRERAGQLAAVMRSSATPAAGDEATASTASLDTGEEVVSALLNLGYPRNRAERVAEAAAAEAGEGATLEETIRAALRGLAK